jgi:hypothetical protein
MRFALVGLGATGSHAARQLTQSPATEIRLFDRDDKRLTRMAEAVQAIVDPSQTIVIGEPEPANPPDVTVIATPAGTHANLAAAMVAAGSHVVSLSDDPREVAQLLELDPQAREAGLTVAVGVGFAPGLSCILTRFAADRLDVMEIVNIYAAGTGGPACARQHHRALKEDGYDWIDGAWILRRGGSGRDLAWFPEPYGARDCYRGGLVSPILIQRAFPDLERISARLAATRRDRFTSRLPMLRSPHADGGPGAVRVEIRGRLDGGVETIILGVMDHPSVAAGTVASIVALDAAEGRAPIGANGLASWPEPKRLLADLRHRGVRVASYSGLLDTAPAMSSAPAPQ